MVVKAILFDLDGTIFDISERDAFSRYEALKELGFQVSYDDVRRHYHFGIGRMGIVRKLGIDLTEREIGEYLKARFVSFTKRKNALDLTKIHDGAYHTLSVLSKKHRLVLVTSRNELSSTEEELGWFKIRKFFDLIVTREVAARFYGVTYIPLFPFNEQRTKLYKYVIEMTKLDPKEMIFVGDSLGELKPAKKLQIRAIGVLTGFDSKEEMEKVSIPTIQDITQLPRILS
jgi:phosphoglycolate phosphatase